MTKNPLKNAKPSTTGKAFVYVTEGNDASANQAFSALDKYDLVSVGSRDTYRNVENNTSVRDQFTRQDYEYFRPHESIPIKDKEIIAACSAAYHRVGIIRNIIDLMGDFGAQGVKLVHPNPRQNRFYRAWWKKVNGTERTERALNLLYRSGVFAVRRRTGKLTVKQEKQLMAQGEDGVLEPDAIIDPALQTKKRNIPIRYVFMNPLMLESVGGELSQFVGKSLYAIKVNRAVRQMINTPNQLTSQLIKHIPKDLLTAIKNGTNLIPLDPDKIVVKHYKKDDWQTWAHPMTYAILDDLMLLEKMKLADLAALDGAISQVRLWKLGDLEKGIFPTDAAVSRLIEILSSNPGGGAFDLVWGPDLTLEEYKTNVHLFLGKKKYEPVMDSIHAGLGVPPTLTGTATSGGFTNNHVSLQTLIKRLDYGRSVVKSFWEGELELVRQAMGHRQAPKIVFDNNILSDEQTIKGLLIQLADRDIISTDTLAEHFGEDPEFELLKLRREKRLRKNKLMNDKAGPWHAPEKFHEYAKSAIPRGFVGLNVDEMSLEDVDTPFEQQLEQQTKMAAIKGEPQQGRPAKSNDKTKRKKKTVKPQGAKAEEILAMSLWAREAQARIADILNPGILAKYNKKSQRALSSEEVKHSEYCKFSILANLSPYSDVNIDIVKQMLTAEDGPTIETALSQMCNSLLLNTRTKLNRELTIDEMRAIQASAYALIYVN